MSEVFKEVLVTGATGRKSTYGTYGFKLENVEPWFNSTEPYADILVRGNTVNVKATKKGKSYVIEKVKLVSEPEAPTPARGGSGGSDRSAVIQYQHSQEMGILATELVMSAGGFKFGKAKAADVETLVLAKVDELTARFYNDIAPLRALGEAEEIEADLSEDEEPEFDDSLDDMFEDDD